MMKLAMENNLSETAFIVKEPEGYHLRWFTPGIEVELCGHATLASSFVILNFYEPDSQTVQFNTMSGVLTVQRKGDLYEMDFPTYELKEIPVTDSMEQAFGIRPVKAVLGLDLVCVFESEEQVRSMHPDQELLMKIEGRIQNATARGRETDCVSRSFCPKLSIAEDPVCGSAHCQMHPERDRQRQGDRLRFPELLPETFHSGRSGMWFRPLSDRGLLVTGAGKEADLRLSGVKAGRLSALPITG